MEWQEVDQVQPDGSVTKIRYADAFVIGEDGIAKIKDGINPEWGMNYTDHTVVAGDTLASIAKQYHMTVEELAKKNKIETNAKLEDGKELIISRNTKFNMMKLRMSSTNKKLNGSVAAIEGPTAEKHLLYDVASFSRKFGTGMFLSRFQMDTSKGNRGGAVWDWDLNETTKGKYITFVQNMTKLLTDAKNYWPIMKEEEKIAIYEID
jgi:LysM repeat protein